MAGRTYVWEGRVRVFAYGLFLAVLAFGTNDFGAPNQQTTDIILQNQDVLDLLTAGLSPEIIIAKVENSRCSFDTSPAVLMQLKERGVPDNIILVMIEAPVTPVEPAIPSPDPSPRPQLPEAEPVPPVTPPLSPKTSGSKVLPKTPEKVPSEKALPKPTWFGPDGETLSFKSEEEVTQFLLAAKVVARQEKIGAAWKMLLEQDGMKLHAIFRDVSVYRDRREEAVFECAAYELSKLLGLHIVPPTVPRRIEGINGSMQIWVEDAVTEQDRRQEGIEPPDKWRWRWVFQSQLMFIFDNLIYNQDRYVSNCRFTRDWRISIIDHTRSFQSHKDLPDPEAIRYCERTLFQRLKELDRRLLDQHLGEFLASGQIEALLKRRDLVVDRIEQLVEKHGPGAVFFTLSG